MTHESFRADRLSLGKTQKQLADMVGVTTRQIQMIEAGQRNPSGPLIKLMGLLVADRIAAKEG